MRVGPGDPEDDFRREVVDGLLEAAGCQYLQKSLWGVLSQGEKQKVLICRALMASFDVLILGTALQQSCLQGKF